MTSGNESLAPRLRRLVEEACGGADGRLPPERDLVRTLGVSRRALRRALAALEAEGRLERRQGAGTFVRAAARGQGALPFLPPERTTPLEVIEVRLALEPALARLAALRGARWDIARIGELSGETGRARSPGAYEVADAAFHRAVAVAAQNALFLGLFDAVIETIERASYHGVREDTHCSKRKAAFARQHGAIAEAIAAREPDRAEGAMRDHLAAVRDQLLAATYARPAEPAR
jgi:DNA-binding FadR family transcriptional regulator